MDVPIFTRLRERLPDELVDTIFYYSLPKHIYVDNLLDQYKFAEHCKWEIDSVYREEQLYPFPDTGISKVSLIYLNNILLNDSNRGHQILDDLDNGRKFIIFYDYN